MSFRAKFKITNYRKKDDKTPKTYRLTVNFTTFTDLIREVDNSDFHNVIDVGYGLILSRTSGYVYIGNASMNVIVQGDKTKSTDVLVRFPDIGVGIVWNTSDGDFIPSTNYFRLVPGDSMITTIPVPINVSNTDIMLPIKEEPDNNNGNNNDNNNS